MPLCGWWRYRWVDFQSECLMTLQSQGKISVNRHLTPSRTYANGCSRVSPAWYCEQCPSFQSTQLGQAGIMIAPIPIGVSCKQTTRR